MARVLTQPELQNFPALEWPDIAPRISHPARVALEQVMETLDGGALTREQCSLLANADGDDLLGLLVAADALRRELVGNIVTYVVNRNINFTNICFVGCKFCAFSRGPRESDTYFLSLEQVAQKAREAWKIGATEVCIQGGLPHGLPPFHYRDILRAVKQAVPGMHIHAFSPMEIVYGVELTGMSLEDYLAHAARQRPRHSAGNGRRNPRRRSPLRAFPQQTFHRAMEASHPHRAQLRHSQHLHADVRTRRVTRALGQSTPAVSRNSAADWRLHRVRPARLRASKYSALPSGNCAIRPHVLPNISRSTRWREFSWPAPSTTFKSRG